VLGRTVRYMNMRCVAANRSQLRVPSAKVAAHLQRYTARFLQAAEVWRIARRPECRRAGMTDDYVRGALGNGERCFAVLDGEYVAHFSWYSRKSPTRINDHWTLHFDESCLYIYYVHTDPKYRGQKLMPNGLTRAITESEADWVVAFVESSNYASLNVFFALGFEEFARIRVVRPFGIPLMVHGDGAKRFAFRVEPTDAALVRAAATQGDDESARILMSQR
jgi:ribosomal protein S18 acetylase RimI-like enzyme